MQFLLAPDGVRVCLPLCLLVGLTACASVEDDPVMDGPDDSFHGANRERGLAEGSPEAIGVLRVANEASGDTLENDVRIGKQTGHTATANILAFRAGADGVPGTGDDKKFENLTELDAVKYVGPVALSRMLAYARAQGWIVVPSGIHVVRAPTVDHVPASAPAPGAYRVHLIDVGSGLAILVQGADFNLLFDGGSLDDSSGFTQTGTRNRLIAYLYAALGPSGDTSCLPAGDNWDPPTGLQTIQHLFLSHPHEDHNNLLDDVLRCYQVQDVWEPGAINDTQSQAAFVQAVASEPGVRYHTAAAPAASRQVVIAGQTISVPESVPWTSFKTGDRASLGTGASLHILYADGSPHPNALNDNSTVIRLDLGGTRVLLAADAEAGPRDEPTAPAGKIEGALLAEGATELDADILQVGHHGSRTSSRLAFLQAVTPRYALVSAGPTDFNGVHFPEAAVMTTLQAQGIEVLRTDVHDDHCPETDRIGVEDGRPGGCDSYIIEIPAN